jgi:hypothetical protein
MKQDLFNTPELLPQEVKDILAKYEEMGTSYDTCHKLIKDLEQVGYTCDYGLDGIPYELKKIDTEYFYSVWVGGVEVNNYLLTKEQAENLAQEWIDDGYDEVAIDDYRITDDTSCSEENQINNNH